MLLLEATGLVKSFDGARVVDSVDLACDRGQIVGLLGPNGAGKTTTLKMLYGFLTPGGGSVRFDGRDLAGDRTAIKRTIGVCPQDDTLDSEFDVVGNLRQMARYFRPRVEDLEARIAALVETFGLGPHARKRPDQLSGGLRRRLSIARAVVHRPAVLFLDEPTTGLDPEARVGVWELVANLRREGLAIVLTTHYMDEAERLSDQLVLLKDGKVLSRGTPKALLGDLMGELVLVVRPPPGRRPAIADWLRIHAAAAPAPAAVLDELRLPLTTAQVGAFCAAFPELRTQVREPDLDDLFLLLARS
jgi:lipooligosaccharide transport system ATP-binding protein